MNDQVQCRQCRQMTPAENLNCIYCGETLPARVGMLSTLRYSYKGCLFALIAIVVIVAFLVLILY